MKYINVRLISLFIVCFAISMAAFTPVQWLIKFVEPQLSPLGVNIEEAEGSVWSGRGLVSIKKYGIASLEWEIHALNLFLLRLPVSLKISNADLNLEAKVTPSISGISISNLTGYIDDSAFSQVARDYGATISGRLQFNSVTMDSSWSYKLGQATGDLTWSGGSIFVPVGRVKKEFQVPMMNGQFKSDELAWALDIVGPDKQEYIDISLLRDGSATLTVKSLLATDMNLPVPANDRPLIEISQKVFNGS